MECFIYLLSWLHWLKIEKKIWGYKKTNTLTVSNAYERYFQQELIRLKWWTFTVDDYLMLSFHCNISHHGNRKLFFKREREKIKKIGKKNPRVSFITDQKYRGQFAKFSDSHSTSKRLLAPFPHKWIIC